jgi:hypothetical protein
MSRLVSGGEWLPRQIGTSNHLPVRSRMRLGDQVIGGSNLEYGLQVLELKRNRAPPTELPVRDSPGSHSRLAQGQARTRSLPPRRTPAPATRRAPPRRVALLAQSVFPRRVMRSSVFPCRPRTPRGDSEYPESPRKVLSVNSCSDPVDCVPEPGWQRPSNLGGPLQRFQGSG